MATTTAEELQPGDRFTHKYMNKEKPAWGASYRNRYYSPGTRVLNIETKEYGRIQLRAEAHVEIH